MLYDPKWQNTTTKPDVFSLESLIAWLEKQPASKRYCYADTGHCLLAQFFRACGSPAESLGNVTVAFRGEFTAHSLPNAFQRVATGNPRTFGAALKRARALQNR